MAKNLHDLKQALYTKLVSDTELVNLLGGEKIYYKQPLSSANYPCVVYDIIGDSDRPFDENDSSGKITRSSIELVIFSKEDTSQQSDNIESRIKAVLNGNGTLTDSVIVCYNCFRTGVTSQRRDVNNRYWVTNVMYRIDWSPKV
jgi:hypothetical protein